MVRKYLLFCGLLVHLVLGASLVYYVSAKLEDNWRVKAVARWMEGEIDSTGVYVPQQKSPGVYSFENIPKGTWLKIHQQSESDSVQFTRQVHSGSAWDSKRGQLVIVGSDTHGENWDNSLYFFDLSHLIWKQAYKPDPEDSYDVDSSGAAVAGYKGQRPWVMHVFDGLNYSVADDTLILASNPGHLKARHFSVGGEQLMAKVKSHPTWLYNFAQNTWQKWPGKATSFFPYASAYDSDRNLVVGFRPDGVYEFHLGQEAWRKVAKRSVEAWHTQAVYDEKHRTFVLFGTNSYGNAVHQFREGDDQSVEMPSAGRRPPGASSPPLAYFSSIGKVVALVDTQTQGGELAQTWLYDTGEDSWALVAGADFPFKVGMNYHMQYSKRDNLLILLANAPPEPASVWVLRL